MILDFESIKPEAAGIASSRLINFARRLENQNIPMHSIIIMRHGKICMETYYAPYTKDTLHRMFSVTKSMVSLAIGLLADEGKISLDDHMTNYTSIDTTNTIKFADSIIVCTNSQYNVISFSHIFNSISKLSHSPFVYFLNSTTSTCDNTM